jgi:site-specific recombinase XerD
MNIDVRAALLELHEQKSEGRIFPSNADGGSNHFARLCDGRGMLAVMMHLLRHTVDTRLIERNINPFIVEELMGHATIAQTNPYSQVCVSNLRQAVKTLENPEWL